MRPSQRKQTQLRPASEFRAYTAQHGAPVACADAADVAHAIARAHCAGRSGAVDGETILKGLRSEPLQETHACRAVRWLLSTIRVHECAVLVTRCGVRHEDLARHLRAGPGRRGELARFLNQFTVRGGTGESLAASAPPPPQSTAGVPRGCADEAPVSTHA